MKNNRLLFLLLLLTVTGSSCVTNKELIYVQPDKKKDLRKEAFPLDRMEVNLIQPGDELYIRVTSFDETSNFFNLTSRDMYIREDVTLISYTVNEEGIVHLPYLGRVSLMNKTLDEASDFIEKELQGYLNQPTVTIKFVNKKVTVLGEVLRPGVYDFYDKRINIFQAIGYAGDITRFGNRKMVLVLREENNAVSKTYLDLLDDDIFSSYYYFIKPNDIIYVQPLRKQIWGIREVPYSLIISTITTALLIMNFLRTAP